MNDTEIHRRCRTEALIVPYIPDNVGPVSVDLRLGEHFMEITGEGVIDTHDKSTIQYEETYADSIILHPGQHVLGTTVESVSLPNDVKANVTGRSTIGRLFTQIHQTAGLCDPGFEGQITLEIVNTGPRPVKLYAGDRVCQITFTEIDPVSTSYADKDNQYNHQRGTTPSGMGLQ